MFSYFAPRKGRKIRAAGAISTERLMRRRRMSRLARFGISGGAPGAPAVAGISPLIDKLLELRDGLKAELEGIVQKATDEKRGALDETEKSAFEAKAAEIKEVDERIAELADEEKRAEAAKKLREKYPEVKVTREPGTYDPGSPNSFFRDVFRQGSDRAAAERLTRHSLEQQEELDRRASIAVQLADELREKGVFRVGGRNIDFERRDVSRTDTTSAGEFVPPLWLLDVYAPLARAGRQFIDSYNLRPLPPGTDSINIPRVTTGGLTGIQTADNAAVAAQDLVSGTVTAPVRTIAGEMTVAQQLIDQSPISFDEVVINDLLADYNMQLDIQAIAGSGAAGQIQGILGLAGINATTYTDGTPTVPEEYPKIASMLNDVAGTRFMPATRIFMHPRRWYWHTAALDGQSRPLVTPIAQGVFNQMGRVDDVQAEGPVGVLQGLPVYIDPNIPANLGAGTNEDRIIASRFADHWGWESTLRTRILPERKSGTLSVVIQLYAYVAATAGRYPKATSVMSGTGLVTPTF